MSSKQVQKSRKSGAGTAGRGRAMSSGHEQQVGRSVSALSSPPIKLRRMGVRSADGKDDGKQQQAVACHKLFQDHLPPRISSTVQGKSGATATTSATAAGSTSMVPIGTFYGRGQDKGVPSVHAFVQPKLEILAMQQAACHHEADDDVPTSSAITISTTGSLAVISKEPEFTASKDHCSIGHVEEVETDIIADDSDFLPSTHFGTTDSPGSVSSQSLIFSPEKSPVQLLSKSPTPEVANTIIRPQSTTAPKIPVMFRPLPPAPAEHQEESVSTAVEGIPSGTGSSGFRSSIWKHFQKIGVGQRAKSNHCGREVSRGRDKGHLSNSGMNQHMRVHHHAVLLGEKSIMAPPPSTKRGTNSGTATATMSASTTSQSKAQKDAVTIHPHPTHTSQATLEAFGGFQSKGMSRAQGRKITRLIGQLIAVGGAPFNMVEGEPFKQLMQAVAPQYRVPSRKTFSQTVVPALYRSCVGVLKEEIGRAGGQAVHLTTDLWSAGSAQHAFLSLTAHWWQAKVSQDLAPTSGSSSAVDKPGHRSFLLHAEVLDEKHTAQNILQALQKMLVQWFEQADSNYRIGYVVTDGGSNMVKAVRDGSFVGVRCSAHILHLVVTDSSRLVEASSGVYGRLSKVVESGRKLAGHFHRSVRDSHLLRVEQRKLSLPEHCLRQDVATRWNSTLSMLERILEQQKALHALACDHYIGIERPLGREDWAIIGQIVAVLQPFLSVTEHLSREDASIGQVLPLFSLLQGKLERFRCAEEPLPSGGPLPDVLALLSTLLQELGRRMQELTASCPELMLAAMCDPRIKGKMAVHFSALTTWRDRLIDRVCQRERQTVRPLEMEEEEDTEPPVSHASSSRAPASGASSVWAEARDNLMGTSSMVCPPKKPTSAKAVVMAYLSTPAMHQTTEPKVFWQEKSEEWPALADIAKELLSCPPTTVQSERVFSVTGNILSPQRSQLSPQLMEQLAFLKINLPKLGYPSLTLDIP